ncbi:PEP-CTERM sorting domain-containing protein [Oleiharenicola lentus]|uniref:PEP-CTERM sorting domain-containing protein n=1 Tax=Oleiharenicola lentus TaxID=2508720 RepID=UPI003F67A577
MKAPQTQFTVKQLRTFGRLACVLASLFFLTNESRAQTQVTGLSYGSLLGPSPTTVGEITYYNYNRTVATISTTEDNFAVNGTMASNVYFRRTSGGNNNATVFYDYNSYNSGQSGADAVVYGNGDSNPTLQEVMLSGNLTEGLRNPFANTNASASLLSNIERIDFYFSGGYTVTGTERLVFFDLENAGNKGDGFRIAAFTAVDGSNTPTAYANTGKLVNPDTFGDPVTSPTLGNSTYLRSSTTNGDNLTGTQSIAVLDSNSGGSSELYLVGIALSFQDLGISVGTKIYGYSLMAGDVSVGSNYNNASRLVNWTNGSTYLTNTDAETWGNMDFMGFGAQLAKPVPEPSTYGVIFVGLCASFFAVRHWRNGRQPRNAALSS